MRKILRKSFFARPTLIVARELVGKFLVRKVGKREVAVMVTETEAYDGHGDRASHASRGETPRNSTMFGMPGKFYVYFVYGMHEMLNIVTGPKGYPAAVLIRGVVGATGPGKLTKYLEIKRTMSGKKAIPESGLWFEDRGIKIDRKNVKRTPRIGVSYAGPVWSKKKYRFVIEAIKKYENKKRSV